MRAWLIATVLFTPAVVAQVVPTQLPVRPTPSRVDAGPPEAAEARIVELHVWGIEKTSQAWLRSYLGLNFPMPVASVDLHAIEAKLLTTAVFRVVRANVFPMPYRGDDYYLDLYLVEKWTVIPVARAVVGGGTPLKVAGIYDTHAFGSLWTLGAEARQYGKAAPGGVLWARAPRWREGYHVLGAELWQDNRERILYDDHGNDAWRFTSHATQIRGIYFSPVTNPANVFASNVWMKGIDLRLTQQRKVTAESLVGDNAPSVPFSNRIRIGDRNSSVVKALLTVVLDDIRIDNLDNDGLRLLLAAGPTSDGTRTHPMAEMEVFHFKLISHDLEVATHALLGGTADQSLNSQYFLGGFDSLRGIPDGAIYGNKAGYLNLELRQVFYRMRYAWWQAAVFSDSGDAVSRWEDFGKSARTTAGFGLRVAIPQVNRLLIRLDYAFSLDRPYQRGFNFGMNQFFQPHKPL